MRFARRVNWIILYFSESPSTEYAQQTSRQHNTENEL